jgi:catechol 2,3-dioxygenase-like lactoylglutathione lyase family enzyme
MTCSSCGRDDVPTIALRSHPDVLVCVECVGWLASPVGITSTPTLPVTELRPAVDFYERAGFAVRVYEDDLDTPGAGFAFVEYDGQSVFDFDVVDIDPERNGAGCYLIVDDADAWHTRMTSAGLEVSPIQDEPCGMREFTLRDPWRNNVRIGSGL